MAKRLIKLLGEPQQNEDRKAAAVITPGMALSIDSNGDWVPNVAGNAGLDIGLTIAAEREEMGLGIDDDYAIDDTVKALTPKAGDRLLVLIPSGQNIQDGEALEYGATAGMFRAHASGVKIMRSLEDVGAVTATTRLRAEVIK